MPKHLPENEKWSIFLNAATNSNNIEVKSVINDEISFTTKDYSVLNSLNNVEALKSAVVHAIPTKVQEVVQITTAIEHSEQISKVLSYNGTEVITHLVDNSFLDSHNINMNSDRCQDEPVKKIITCRIEKDGIKTVLFKQEQVNFGYLQSMLRDPKELAEILIENKSSLTEDDFTGEDSNFGQNVLSVVEFNKSFAEVKFNYGLIQHKIQEQYSYGAPVIYSSSAVEDQFVISKNYLLGYMYEIFPSGVIFAASANNKLQPIMFQPASNNLVPSDAKTSFEIVLDRSGSMGSVFPEYKQKIISIVTQITDNTKNWHLSVTAFDHEQITEKFDSNNSNLQDITKFISGLSARGTTHLYDAMHNRMSQISKLTSGENAVIVVFTDGTNNGGTYANRDVTSFAYDLRESNPQFAMYTMGYGTEYTQSFFGDMASNGGFTHLHLGELDQIQEFNQYVSTINNCKVIYSYESGEARFFEQCAAGDIAISSNFVSDGSILKIAGESYGIGTEVSA